PLALIPAIAGFIGYGIFGFNLMGIHASFANIGIRHAFTSFISTLGGAYLSAWIIAFLADKFESIKNFDKAFSLVAYSYTPMCVDTLVGSQFVVCGNAGRVVWALPALPRNRARDEDTRREEKYLFHREPALRSSGFGHCYCSPERADRFISKFNFKIDRS
ncbi:MAG TPA: Yip1 family protein, partial [Petrimonas sp.]|nr:Yip1 family protein [Petrimonas sp.]